MTFITPASDALARAAASRTIVPGASISGITLGMSRSEVIYRLGKPSKTEKLHGALGTAETLFSYPQLAVLFSTQGADLKATSISTTRKNERLADGVGVGTALAVLRAKLPSVRCSGNSTTKVTCQMGNPKKGDSRLTSFFLAGGRVTTIAVALSINS